MRLPQLLRDSGDSESLHAGRNCPLRRGYKHFETSDAGAAGRPCGAFKICAPFPIVIAASKTYASLTCDDLEMGGGSLNFQSYPGVYQPDRLAESTVVDAASWVLRAKLTPVIFEHPYQAVPASDIVPSSMWAETLLLDPGAAIIPLRSGWQCRGRHKSDKLTVSFLLRWRHSRDQLRLFHSSRVTGPG